MGFILSTAADSYNTTDWDLKLKPDGQLDFRIPDLSDTESYSTMVAQRIRSRLSTVRGEWYQDQRMGTPYRENIWGKITPERVGLLKKTIYDVVKFTPGVKSVSTIEVDLNKATRRANIYFEVTTDTNNQVNFSGLDLSFKVL